MFSFVFLRGLGGLRSAKRPTIPKVAFLATLGNNDVVRPAFVSAIALWLSFSAAGMSQAQNPAGAANSAQVSAAPSTSGEAVRPEPQNAPANVPANTPAHTDKTPTGNSPASPPASEQAPAESTPATPANPQPSSEEQKTPSSQTTNESQTTKQQVDASTSKDSASKRSASKRSSSHRPAATATLKRRKRVSPAPNDAPRKVVIREGGANEPPAQIAPGMPPDEAARQRRDAEQWLSSTDTQLKQLTTRTLGARQQETMAQIRNYLGGARSALKDGHVQRANTLAQKAYLLADDLMKH